jgi:hypothetical protein
MHTLDRTLNFLNTVLLSAILAALVAINHRIPAPPPTAAEFEAAKNDWRKRSALEKRIPRIAIDGSVSVESDVINPLEVYIPDVVEVRTDARNPLEVHINEGR